jgi:putative membrane protein
MDYDFQQGGIMELFAQFKGLINFLVYFGTGALLTALFIVIYTWVTPQKEFDLISRGNAAAAYSLGGAVLGFVIPLSSAIINSVNLIDMVIWGLVALIIQISVFYIVKFIFKNLTYSIEKGNVAEGMFLGALSLAAGILNAACMSY